MIEKLPQHPSMVDLVQKVNEIINFINLQKEVNKDIVELAKGLEKMLKLDGGEDGTCLD